VITLTPLELAIMKSLWRRNSARVKDVQPDLLPDRDLAYTTVMTIMDRLFKKGILRRAKKSRAHVYEPVYSEAEVRADAVSGLVNRFFDGSETRLKAYLGGNRETPQPPPRGVARREAVPIESTIDDSLL
jgi:BlaI family penicillinase repressor